MSTRSLRVSGPALLGVDRSTRRDLSDLTASPLSAFWDDPQALWNDPQKLRFWELAGRLAPLTRKAQKGPESPEDGPPWKECEQGLVAPGHRGRHYKLHDDMARYDLSRGTVRKCRRCRIAKDVPVVLRHQKGKPSRAGFKDLVTCGSVWACPICGNKIKAERAKELIAMAGAHGGERTAMLTLTIRHGAGDDFKELLEKFSLAWKKFQQGTDWVNLCKSFGLKGTTRALEATHGKNGWHPHYHATVYFERALDAGELDQLRELLSERWRQKVLLVFGAEHVPSDERGCDLRKTNKADYLSKMGLEMTDFSATKTGRGGSRTAWQIVMDAIRGLGSSNPEERRKGMADKKLWLNYAASIKGRKMLTHSAWASDLRASIGIADESDDELGGDGVRDEDKEDVREVIVIRLEPFQWKAVCCVRGARGHLLDLVEQGAGAAQIRQFVLSCRRAVEEKEAGRVVTIEDDDLSFAAPS